MAQLRPDEHPSAFSQACMEQQGEEGGHSQGSKLPEPSLKDGLKHCGTVLGSLIEPVQLEHLCFPLTPGLNGSNSTGAQRGVRT